MLVSDILRYWYGVEVPQSPRRLHGLILLTADAFSMPLLLRTLFVPWRKDVVSARGRALQERIRIFWYNLIAVLVGFFVRLFVLAIASFAVGLIIFVGSILMLLWIILPALPIVLFFFGVVLLFR